MQIIVNAIILWLLISLLGLGFAIIYRIANAFHLLHAISISCGAYISYFVSIQCNLSLFIALPISILFGIGLMIVANEFIYKPLQKRRVESWQILIASLGAYVVLQNVTSLIWGDNTLSFRTWPVLEGHHLMGAYITDIQIITVIVSIGLLILSWLFLEKTSIGQQIKAVSSNPELSSIVGISKDRATVWSFIIGSSLATWAGILIAADTDMTPTMGFNWLLSGVVAMIIGGMGKIRYLLLGALLLAAAQHLAAYYLDSKWMNATAYFILIAFLYFRPYGFSGQPLKKAEI